MAVAVRYGVYVSSLVFCFRIVLGRILVFVFRLLRKAVAKDDY